MNYHCNNSFNAVVNEALGKAHLALQMAEDNRDHARAHNAHGIAKQDEATMALLIKVEKLLNRSLRD
jgi:chemotaxis signal transduction protein